MSAPEVNRAFWAKCWTCDFIWPAAYYPQEMTKFAAILSRCTCPKCGERKQIGLAKQDGGVLQEPASDDAVAA